MPKPRLWHANPTETRDTRTSCGGIGHCSNLRPNNQSGWVLGFGLIADRAMGPIRSIIPHLRTTARRIATSNQSDQSFLMSFGRTNSAACIGRGIVDGIPIGPMPGQDAHPNGPARSSPTESSFRVFWSRRNCKPDPNRNANPVGGVTACATA